MNKKYIWGIIVIIILIGAYFVFSNKNSNVSDTTNTNNYTGTKVSEDKNALVQPANTASIVVNYTDAGFVPPTITVKAGDTVRFVNQSSGSMWVASDPHPTHTDYPGFDEKQVVMRGGIYEFMFNAVGTWGYHNHVNHTQTGTIVVK